MTSKKEWPIMVCGCAAHGRVAGKGGPYCITHGTHEVMDPQPDLAGRVAVCASCDRERPSSEVAPYFLTLGGCKWCAGKKLDPPKDLFYCGCRGWD